MRWRLPAVQSPGARYALVLIGAGLTTIPMIPLREHISILNEAMVYLLFVVIVAARWGLGPGIAASVAVNVLLDFFFVPPIHGLALSKYEDVFALSGFLAATAVVGAVLARVRDREEDARLRQQESQLLYELSTLVLSEVGGESALDTICLRLHFALAAEATEIVVLEGERADTVASAGEPFEQPINSAEVDALLAGYGDPPRLQDSPRTVVVPMRAAGETLGAIRVRTRRELRDGSPGLRLASAFAQVAALSVHHARLLQQVTATLALEKADSLKSALLAAVSHELRTPLASIKASATSLLDPSNSWLESDRRELLGAIDAETDRLTRLVSDLLDLSRIEGGALTPRRDWYDLRELLETVINRMTAATKHHKVELAVDRDGAEAFLDYVQFGQVVSNLIENAAKFAPRGTVITVRGQTTDHETLVTVSDAGSGVPLEDRGRVFDRFYRGRASGPIPGSGLGLAICRGIVHAHGGEISLNPSSPSGGASFTVHVPRPVHVDEHAVERGAVA